MVEEKEGQDVLKNSVVNRIFDNSAWTSFFKGMYMHPEKLEDSLFKYTHRFRTSKEAMSGKLNENAFTENMLTKPSFLQGQFSDATMLFTQTASLSRCADLELNAAECLEYYGSNRGRVLCKDYYDDMMECMAGNKQRLRLLAMFAKRRERYFEYLAGKRGWSTVYLDKKHLAPGSYIDPCPSSRDALNASLF